MRRTKQVLMVCVLLALLSNLVGCASGVKYEDYVKSMPELDAQKSRLFIYRPSVVGAAIQPQVILDNAVVCKAVPKGFTYKDVSPGNHKVQCSTEVERNLSLTTKAGQTKYIKLGVSIGFFIGHISPKLVEEETALKELQKCKYIEK